MDENFLEIRDLERAKKILEDIPNGVEKASIRAINRSLTTLKKNLKKEVTRNYGIKSNDVEKSLSTKKPTYTAISGLIRSKAPTISMYKFFKSQNKKGVTVLIKKSEGKHRVKGKDTLHGIPFVAKMANGHYGIFQRNNRVRKVEIKDKSYKTQGLTQLNTLSIPQMLGSNSVMEYVKNNGAQEMVEQNFEREVDKILKGYYKK
ncbi:hypothetical protein IX317_001846 [Fusobacterium sp. DD29]|uniref:phage tail protein n=1 Tax=unclassified Fusobacterium TaxID=2648384 RepID=UPI001B8D7A04|nr:MULTISPECIES: phage tail protein [unclassified Fusobacterium]MBR8701156.1 hypothetical protein [Fusobacterium sp. DD45]MBR8711331.1 hypothetical protein [Fusobacterium sp. DD28]MBR8750162.1 hypothetical protein [Fusobacterium sp. DD29]MBR8751880.1 hypothetical protein [Fusobacterium sp. DD26]MBR8762404.1 hypothetical protein [Fusobacterium sp. DD25]